MTRKWKHGEGSGNAPEFIANTVGIVGRFALACCRAQSALRFCQSAQLGWGRRRVGESNFLPFTVNKDKLGWSRMQAGSPSTSVSFQPPDFRPYSNVQLGLSVHVLIE